MGTYSLLLFLYCCQKANNFLLFLIFCWELPRPWVCMAVVHEDKGPWDHLQWAETHTAIRDVDDGEDLWFTEFNPPLLCHIAACKPFHSLLSLSLVNSPYFARLRHSQAWKGTDLEYKVNLNEHFPNWVNHARHWTSLWQNRATCVTTSVKHYFEMQPVKAGLLSNIVMFSKQRGWFLITLWSYLQLACFMEVIQGHQASEYQTGEIHMYYLQFFFQPCLPYKAHFHFRTYLLLTPGWWNSPYSESKLRWSTELAQGGCGFVSLCYWEQVRQMTWSCVREPMWTAWPLQVPSRICSAALRLELLQEREICSLNTSKFNTWQRVLSKALWPWRMVSQSSSSPEYCSATLHLQHISPAGDKTALLKIRSSLQTRLDDPQLCSQQAEGSPATSPNPPRNKPFFFFFQHRVQFFFLFC